MKRECKFLRKNEYQSNFIHTHESETDLPCT